MGRADEEIAEAEGSRWRDNPAFAERLGAVQRWREAHEASSLLEVLGQPEADGWSVGQDWALGQLRPRTPPRRRASSCRPPCVPKATCT